MLCIKWALILSIILLIMSTGFVDNIIAQKQKSQIESLVEKSEVIVLGKVTEMRSEWNKNKSKIFTKVSIKVIENFKGSENNQTIVITHLGGEVDGVGELYSHMPKFTQDEEALIFAKRDKENNLIVTNGLEGKFQITKNMTTGEKTVGLYKSLDDFSSSIKSIIKK